MRCFRQHFRWATYSRESLPQGIRGGVGLWAAVVLPSPGQETFVLHSRSLTTGTLATGTISRSTLRRHPPLPSQQTFHRMEVLSPPGVLAAGKRPGLLRFPPRAFGNLG